MNWFDHMKWFCLRVCTKQSDAKYKINFGGLKCGEQLGQTMGATGSARGFSQLQRTGIDRIFQHLEEKSLSVSRSRSVGL